MTNKRLILAFTAVAIVHLAVGVAIFAAYRQTARSSVPPVIEDGVERTVKSPPAPQSVGGDRPPPALLRPGEVQSSSETVHIVKPGDTYWGLARQYGVSVQRLREYNGHTSSHMLKTNERLRIPAR